MYEVNYFPEPDAYNFGQQLVKFPVWMVQENGKSEGTVFSVDTPQEIKKKVMRAVTDTGPTARVRNQQSR